MLFRQVFYDRSFFYQYMLSFSETIRSIIDCSSLWYREFYLEVTKCVQFPISMSLPWIMIDFLIKTPSQKENIFFPIDIYNDAAALALYGLKQQFLYDEIQAELNLSFEQLIFHLSEDIFKYFKTQSSAILINKPYENKYFQSKQIIKSQIVESRYVALMGQRTIQLLGRSVDIQLRISEQVNDYLRKNIDYIIRRFESSELSTIIEFNNLLDNVKMTHELLSEYLTLDSWSNMFKEINEDSTLGNFKGRIVWHIFSELIGDVLPNFIFNDYSQRFVRGTHTFTNPIERSRPPSNVNSYYWYGRKYQGPFDKLSAVFRGYIGPEHFDSLLRVIDLTSLPLIIHELISEAQNKIIYDFGPYAKAMIDGIPQLKLPRVGNAPIGIIGAYGFYDVKLRTSLGNYPPLRPNVFQSLRELGNNLLFLRSLETALNVNEGFNFQQHAYYQGIKPLPLNVQRSTNNNNNNIGPYQIPESDQQTPVQKEMRNAYTHLTQNYSHKLGMEDQTLMNNALLIADECSRTYSVNFESQSLLTEAIKRLTETIRNNVLHDFIGNSTSRPDNIFETDYPKDIARLLSCLNFIFVQPTDKFNVGKINDMAAFGDGATFAMCLLLHCSGQKRKFELLDIAHNIYNMDILEPIDRQKHIEFRAPKSKTASKMTDNDKQEVTILEFLTAYKLVKNKTDSFFHCLESYYTSPKINQLTLHPPQDEKEIAVQAGHHVNNNSSTASTSVSASTSYQPVQSHHTNTNSASNNQYSSNNYSQPPPPLAPILNKQPPVPIPIPPPITQYNNNDYNNNTTNNNNNNESDYNEGQQTENQHQYEENQQQPQYDNNDNNNNNVTNTNNYYSPQEDEYLPPPPPPPDDY